MPTIRCPGCQQRYKVSESAGGKRTKCKKCGKVIRIPEFAAPPPAPIPLADDGLDFDAVSDLAKGEAVDTGPPAEAIPVNTAVDYAPGARGAEAEAPRGAYKRYLTDVGRSAAMIFTSGSSFAAFFVMLIILFVGEVVGFATIACCLAIIPMLIVLGWYMSFQINVVLGAAGGEEDLPTLALTGGFMDDVVAPFFKMLAAYAFARVVPASVLVTAELQAGAPPAEVAVRAFGFVLGNYELLLDLSNPQSQVICGVALGIGMLMLPMFILVVAVGGFGALPRVDLMLVTIFRSFPAYLIVAIITLGVEAGGLGIAAVDLEVRSKVMESGFQMSPLMLAPIGLITAGLYVTIIQMRAIGLYYHHFKHRFAWSWG
jgi:hypothetical protein